MVAALDGGDVTTYAVIPPDDGTTFYYRALDFASLLCDHVLFVSPDGFRDTRPTEPLGEMDAQEVVTAAYVSARNILWDRGDLWVLIDAELLDRETGNPFRRRLRVVLERLEPEAHFPYDELETADKRAGWLTECLETGEIVDPESFRGYAGEKGVSERQRDLHKYSVADRYDRFEE